MKTNEFLRMNLTPHGIIRWGVTVLCTLLLSAQLSFAQDFTANQLGDFGNVTVMEANGGFDELLPDGTENVAARQSVAKEFFRTHKDEYDTVVIFTNFDYRMKDDGRIAFYSHVKNDVQGIGQQIYDNSKDYGSNGRLYGTIDMGNYLKLISNPLDPKFNFTTDTLIHETLHRWAAYVKFKDWNNNVSDALLGQDKAHWSFLLDSAGSTLYGNKWKDNGNGTFTSTAVRKYYSPLDLYVMGMIDKSKVPPTLLIDNPAIDPTKMPEIGDTINGTAHYVNVDDIIAVQDQGERIPNAKDSQKQFKTAFIYVVSPGTFKSDDLYGIENIRNAYLTRFSILTDGKGLVQVTSSPKDDLPINPGVRPPSTTPRTLPPSIDNGVTWLMNRQQTDGSWTDFVLTTERDTAETATTLQHFPVATQSSQAGFAWLGSNSSANTDFLARRIEAAVQAGSDSSALVQELLARRNRDGGWGSNRNFISSATDTALALKALAVVGYNDNSVTVPAITYLKSSQNADGGWSGDDAFSTIQPTTAVLTAFNYYRKSNALESNLTQAVAFLALKQNTDGGFGNSPSTVYDSALSVIALQAAGADKTLSGRGVSYLLGQQSDNGAWFDSPYQTALAVRAVWAATVDPDLSIKPEDISVIPATITTIPTNAVLSATVWNLGRSDVPQAKVAVYDGVVTPDKKVAEQTVAFPGQSPTMLTFSIPVTDSKGHVFHVVVDPDNQLVESNKNNNSALKSLMPEITYDFQVLASDISVTPNPVDIAKDVKISVKVSNSGTSDAFNVPVRVFINQPGAPLEIATLTVDLPAGGSAVKETTWKASLAGVNQPLTVQIDPNNTFTETSKDNNSAFVPLTVNASTLPNLSVSYKDMVITPSPAREGGSASISVLVKNDGYSAVENVKVSVYNGTASNGGTLLGSQVIPAIAVGQSARTAIGWTGIAVNGGQLITVQVDPDIAIQELSKDDNFTFLNLDVLSLPDLAISASSITINPATPKSGETVTIAVTVQNGGDQEAKNVNIQVKETGTVIGSTIIPLVNGNSQATGTITYVNAGQIGTHQLSVTVDPGNLIVEKTKDNNTVVKTFSIQDANLWLTEPYISPNGDGIKDTTDFSFRLAAQAKVSVQVVNKKGVTVRTFSGGELDNTAGLTVTWDGKNDTGSVVDDGTYQIKVVGPNNAMLASLPVEVDTNRSPLADAIGTNYLVTSSLTCGVSPPSQTHVLWMPDESRVFFSNSSDSGYPKGVFSMAPDGSDIVNLLPASLLSTGTILNDAVFSEDRKKFAIVVYKENKSVGQLWIVDSDGGNPVLIKSVDTSNYGYLQIMQWSHDNNFIVYQNSFGQQGNSKIYTAKSDGTQVLNVDNTTLGSESWRIGVPMFSPDNRQIAFIPAPYTGPIKLIILNIDGSKKEFDLHGYSSGWSDLIKWINNGVIISDGYDGYSFVNIENGNIIKLADWGESFPSPDSTHIAILEGGWGNGNRIKLIDNDANVTIAHEISTDGINKITWSHDSSKLIIDERIYDNDKNQTYSNNILYDMATGTTKLINSAIGQCRFDGYYNSCDDGHYGTALWLADDINILAQVHGKYYFINTSTLEQYELARLNVNIDGTPYVDGPPNVYIEDFYLSPMGTYINYVNWDQSGVCGHNGSYEWSIRSIMNLTVDLRVNKNRSAITLNGTAADKNFADYRLEFADIKTPGNWNLIMPPSDIPVVNDRFTDWAPPNEGTFLVRLTAWDKAGNQTAVQKKVVWGISTLVAGSYIDNSFIAPKNPDNPKKTVTLNYTALDAVHLEFTIVNDKGDTIRSFTREQTGYAVDSIVWDGRDENGTLVPDGKYTIKLFDYEFGVEVDNTLPTVSIGLSGITYDKKQSIYSVKLSASAADVRLKKWTLQVGTGENPQDWSTVASGTDNISTYSYQYINGEIAFLKYKRFRIVAEDFAGNQSFAISPLLESKVIFAGFVDNKNILNILDDGSGVNWAKGVVYNLMGFESVALPTQKVILQFSDGSGWKDAQEQLDGGLISFLWQHPDNVTKPYGLRFKEVTASGSENFSRIVKVNEIFSGGYTCRGLLGQIYLFESLQKLEVTVTSSTGKSITQLFENSSVPVGDFGLPVPVEAKGAVHSYLISMKGTGLNGGVYTFLNFSLQPLPSECKGDGNVGGSNSGGDNGGGGGGGGSTLAFDVIYPEALACGKTSGGILLPTERLSLAGAKRVDYLVKVGTTQQVIGEVDIEHEGPVRVSVDSSLLPSGSYPLSVIVTNTDNTQKQTDLGKVVVFDTESPQAKLFLPASPCPVRTVTPKGTRLGVDVSGSATDNIRVDHYALYYGLGDNPTSWSPAMSMGSDGVSKPIAGDGAVSGRLGTWDITDIPGSVFTLKLEVVDAAGNKGCATGVVKVDREIKINGYNLAPLIFSPNNDGILDTVTTGFSLDEPATVDLSVYTIAKDINGTDVLGALQRHVQSGLQFAGGAATFDWDGKGDSGAVLPDNRYGVSLTVTDACSNTATQWKAVDLDNTPPVISIDYPLPGNPLPPGVMIEIKGTATDPHFKSYLLEAGEGNTPATWITLASAGKPISNGVITSWNTFGLKNIWTLRLTAEDTVGNKKVATSTIDLGIRKELVKSLDATPKLFSPNNDQKLDTSLISYEVTDACNLRIDILDGNGQVVRTFTTVTTAAGTGSYVWDGKNSLGSVVPDGSYTVRLAASLSANPQTAQTETISLVVDTTPPAITIADLTDKSYLNRTDLSITGTISDTNLAGYNIAVVGPSGTTTLNAGTQNRANYTFGRLTDLTEDTYTLTVDASDLGQNQSKLVRTIIIDRTPPKVTLDTPKGGEFYGNTRNVIDISGTIVEKNLDRYSLRYGVGETPIDWKEVVGGDTIPTTAKLFSLKVGKTDGIADGIYTLSLYAKDKAGLEGEARTKIVIDNTPPQVAITSPKDGDYVTKSLDIKGTVADTYFDNGTLELAVGSCASAVKWAITKTLSASVQDSILDSWKVLPTDGEYCLRLLATDKSGNKSETKIGIKIDTHPPFAPQLTGKIDNKVDAVLSWTKSTEPDFAGYNLYRNSQKVNVTLLTDITYRDAALKEGSYIYTVKAVDFAGNESDPSNTVTLKIDLTGPTVRISTPKDGAAVSNLIDVKGTAYSQDDFKEYRVYIGQGSSPSSWTLIRRSPLPISYGSLAQWDTITNQDGSQYTLKLEGEDTNGNISTTQVSVAIDNTPPKAPVLLTTVATGADVALTWKANTEADLAGYLLYRNDQLAKVKGIVAGNIKPYLVTGTAYADKALPDGTYRYYLVAMDQAGNAGDQSNTLEVSIDTHPPHMTITAPTNGQKFESKLTINAETPDNDIATVQFQYKRPQDVVWTNLGAQFVKSPYITYFDPKGQNLPYGDYQFQVLSTDQHNNNDKTPTVVTVTYADLTPPEVPTGLAAKVTGADVNLTWTAVSETGVSYNIYRWNSETKSVVNSVPVKTASFVDLSLPDGTYQYEITALDVAGNESKASGQATAKIYAPIIIQPFTPLKNPALVLDGNGVDPGTPVQVTTTLPSEVASTATITADAAGAFRLEGITLALGENRFAAVATDSAGNISRNSETIVIVYDMPPAAPTGLVAAVQDYSVQLTWDPNSEQGILGYNLFRDNEKVNTGVDLTGGQATASYQDYYSMPQNAFDGNNGIYWGTSYGNGTFTPAWWQISLLAPELINRVEIDWQQGDWDSVNNRYNIFAGKDYEVQAWTGYNWVTLKKIVGNDQQTNTIDISPSYRTNQIRISITSTTDQNYSKYVRINEIRFRKDNLLSSPQYMDTGLSDNSYNYTVSAVDSYGLESDPSSPVEAIVGDVIPPTAPTNLKASVNVSEVILDWSTTPNTEPDLAGYSIYWQDGQNWVNRDDVSATTLTYTVSSLPNGIYHYRITAYDLVGNESDPSNVVSATVSIVSNPPLLSVTTPPERQTLIASWQASGGTTVAYNLYRSQLSGGGYIRVNPSPVQNLSYKDVGLTNGTAYYYVVTSLDQLGNESAYSKEAFGVPQDIAPARPIIFAPIKAGEQLVVYNDGIDVVGSTEPGLSVELLRGGDIVGSVTALMGNVHTTKPFDINGYMQGLSPDGTAIVFNNKGAIWLKKLDSGSVTMLANAASGATWSPDGGKIAFSKDDSYWYQRIVIYDVASATSTFLTDDTSVNEYLQSWSDEGTKIAFRSNRSGTFGIWLKNLTDNTLIQVADNIIPSNLSLSPDAAKVAYFTDLSLFVINISDGKVSQIDDRTDQYSIAWTPDSNKIAFISYKDGDNGLFVTDLTNQVTTKVLGSLWNNFSQPVWSPDGTRIVYNQFENYGRSLRMVGLGGEQAILLDNLSYIYPLGWTKNGYITFGDDTAAHTLKLKGTFTIPKVQLVAGENQLYAIANDGAGFVSPPSDSISVVFDTGNLPDLSITDSDLTFFPPYPKPGDDVVVTARVHNPTNNPVDNATVELYLWDGMNDVTLLTSEIIPHLDANGEGEVSVRFNAGTTIGTRTVIAVADPANLIAEVSKTNNYASKDLIVTDQEKVTLTSSLNATQYVANQDLFATVKLHNSGLPKTGMLYVAVEDATGTPVKVLTNQSTELPYGADTTQTFSWNTITTFSGAYRLHATISDGSTVLGEGITPFSILPDLKVSAGIVTDRQQYGSRQDVGLAVSFKNTGVNYLIPQLRARVRVLGPQNTEQYSGEQTVANLMTGASGSLSFTWNTGLLAPGPYTATLDIFAGDKLVTSSLANFTIIPSVSIGGSIKADPAVAVLGSGFTANYTLTNNGNAGASGTAQVSLIDQDTSTVVATTEQATILPLGNTVPGNAMFQTDGLKLKNYLLKLNFVSNGNSTVIATTPLSIKDGTPPVLTVSTLADGSLASSSVLNIAGTVTDNVGVKQLLINGVSVPFGPDGTFSHALLLKPGENKVEVQATDLAGNSASDSRTIYQDQRAPVLVVTSPADNSKTNKQQIDVTGHVDETSTVEVRVNGLIQPVTMDGNNFTASVTLQPGAAANTIDITATNLAMKSSSDKRSVYYDDQAPALAITAPGQDIRTNQANLTIRGTASDLYGYGVTVSLDVNGQKFTPQLIDGKFEQAVTFTTEETYHIEATATNEMGTSSSVQRNVIYDITPPAFTIDKVISPTNQQSQVVSGTRDTDATVTVSCITATVGPVEYPTATTWKASLNSLTAGDNTITATATDGAGNPNSVPVHIIYDSTPPTGSILINNGAGFTAVTQVTLNLSAADANNVTTMRLSNDGSTWTDPESCATTRVWNLLSGDGQKTVYVQYKDAAENWTVDPIVASIVLDTTPPIVTATPAGGTYNTTQTVQLMANETAIIYYTINGATPTTASAVYSRPLTIASNTTLKSLAIDSAGNPGIHTEGYVIDTIPPTGTIAINSGATITNSAQVMLTLSASDANGVSKMRFSNDGSAWSDSENYATSRVWYLASGDGTKRVFASYQDTAGNWSVPVSADITLDTIPPVVSASPAGGIFNTPQSVKLTASENSVIRFTTDGSTPAANSAVYHFPIPITASTTLHYMAVDTAGNPSDVKTESYIIDTIPPTLTVSTLANGAYTNNQVLNIAGSATDTSGINSLTINGAGAQLQQDGSFSQALVLQPGPNAVTVVATDLASNSSTDARTVNLDMTVPQITITSPADNTKTATSVMPVTGSVSETSTVSVKLGSNIQNAVMNATAFSASVNLSPGTNTIEVTAIDPANNARTQKRTVVYDNQKPSLTITDPPQDIRTNLSGLILRGTVSDIYTQVNVTITMDGQSYTPPVVNGSFQQALTFTQEKNYAILVTATNEAGGSTSTQRNVIYDVTPPALTINPVTSPTMTDSQTISGTREASLDVSVSSSTATIGIVTYPTSTTWQVSVTGLKPGSNIITVSTTDAANNVASASKEIVYTVSTLSGNFSAAIFGNAKVTMSNGSYTDSYVGNPATWSKGQHKNGDIGTNSLQSCAIQITGGTQVFGKAWVGHGGNPVSGVSVTGGSSITGGTGALAVAKDMTPKKDPAGGTALGALTLTGGASRTLTAGEYRITSLDLSNGTTLTLNGAITLHNSGNFSINGGSKIVITNGPVVIYQNGQKIDISNGVIVNNSQSPKNFTIYGTQGLKTINLTGGTSVHALIYAPTAAITISGGQNTFGSVIGNTVDISGGSSVHYDESLKN